MDIGIAIFASVLGSTGLFGLIQFLISRNDSKNRDAVQIKAKLDTIENRCIRNELATTRLQLFFLLETQSDNEDAIETTAQRYFIELDGDAEAWAPFHRWAVEHKVDVGWYHALLERERRRQNDKCD